MGDFNWQPFLKLWSEEMLEAAENVDDLPQEAVEARWLGFPGATEEQIAEAESRLGMMLPPSYREFLMVTNGWRQPEAFSATMAGDLWSTEQVQWFSADNQEWIDAYVRPAQGEPTWTASDEEYLVYGDGQDCALSLRPEYLQTALQISDAWEGVYLLNPQIVTAEGEWEAWFFANWLPGADRFRSFRELIHAQHQSWKRYLPLLKGEMTEAEYDFYASSQAVKNV